MEGLLLGGKYLWLLLQRLGKDLRICAEELGLGDPLVLEGEGHHTMDDLVLHHVLAPHAMLQVLEAVIDQGLTLRLLGGEVITPLPQKEGMILEDHQEVLLPKTEKLTTLVVGHILPVMTAKMAIMGNRHRGRHLGLDPGLLKISLLLPADRYDLLLLANLKVKRVTLHLPCFLLLLYIRY